MRHSQGPWRLQAASTKGTASGLRAPHTGPTAPGARCIAGPRCQAQPATLESACSGCFLAGPCFFCPCRPHSQLRRCPWSTPLTAAAPAQRPACYCSLARHRAAALNERATYTCKEMGTNTPKSSPSRACRRARGLAVQAPAPGPGGSFDAGRGECCRPACGRAEEVSPELLARAAAWRVF